MVLYGYEVDRGMIPAYLNDQDAMRAISFFADYQAFGWPFGGGWAEQPAHLVDIVRLLSAEMAKRNHV